jgi:hypothetical protein
MKRPDHKKDAGDSPSGGPHDPPYGRVNGFYLSFYKNKTCKSDEKETSSQPN